MKLPQEFAERMKLLLGEEYEEFLETYEEPRRYGLRINTLKISAEEFERLAPFSVKRLPWIPGGYWYEREEPGAAEGAKSESFTGEIKRTESESFREPEGKTESEFSGKAAGKTGPEPSRHPFYCAGLYYLQEPSAMTPASVLPVEPGDRVLDLCAAPGGKATALAAKLQREGLLVANDISASRAKALLKNLEVFGVTNAFVTNAAPPKLAEQFPLFFDKILVDAPCSGEGMFRKDAANARAWSPEKVEACAKIQKGILRSAVSMLRPGGLLLYSTCTFAPEEDEQAAAYLLREFPEMELCDIPWYEGFSHGRPELGRESWQENLAAGMSGFSGQDDESLRQLVKCVRIFPHKMRGEGHFLALFRKKEQGEVLSGSEKRKDSFEASFKYAVKNDFPDERDRNTGRNSKEKAGRSRDAVSAGRRKEEWRQSGSARGVNSPAKKAPSKAEWEILRNFLRDVYADYPEDQIEIRNGQAYLVPEALPKVQGIPFLRNGLYLGEIRQNRFEPSQSLAMALQKDSYASVINFSADDERVYRYLKGETIGTDDITPAREKGWQLVCADGYPLGWGKLTNGTLKNKYHSGWRM